MWVTLKRGSVTTPGYRFDQGRTWCTDPELLAFLKARAGGKGTILEGLEDGADIPDEGFRIKAGTAPGTSGTLTVDDLKNAKRSHEPRVEPEPEPEAEKAEVPEVVAPDTEFPCRYECDHRPYKSEAARERHEASKHGPEGTEEA